MDKLWTKLRVGDPLTTPELEQMLAEAKQTEKFLEGYGQSPALLFRLRQDISDIEGFLRYRANNPR